MSKPEFRVYASRHDSMLLYGVQRTSQMFMGYGITYHGRLDAAVALQTFAFKERATVDEDLELLPNLLPETVGFPFGGAETFDDCLAHVREEVALCTLWTRSLRIHGFLLELHDEQIVLDRFYRLGDPGGTYRFQRKNIIALECGGIQHQYIAENRAKQSGTAVDPSLTNRQRSDPHGKYWRINIP